MPQQIVGVQGVLARRICDLRLGFAAMAVPDGCDPWSVGVPFDQSRHRKGARVAVVTQSESNVAEGEVAAALQAASDALHDAGLIPEAVCPPRFDEAAQLWLDIVLASNQYNLAPLINQYGSEKVKKALHGMLSCSTIPDLPTFMAHFARRDTILRAWNEFFDRYIAIIMPVSWEPVFCVDEDQDGDERMREIMKAQSALLAPSILGLPSVAVPVQPADGVRQGVQVIGASFGEPTCLALAEEIEARLPVATPVDPRRGHMGSAAD